jgi:hypothetical protein
VLVTIDRYECRMHRLHNCVSYYFVKDDNCFDLYGHHQVIIKKRLKINIFILYSHIVIPCGIPCGEPLLQVVYKV